MTTASQVDTQQRPWWLTLIGCILAVIVGAILLWSPAKTRVETYQILVAIPGVLGIIFGIALMVNYSVPGMGLAMLWTAAVFGVIGGIAMIIQAFQQRSA